MMYWMNSVLNISELLHMSKDLRRSKLFKDPGHECTGNRETLSSRGLRSSGLSDMAKSDRLGPLVFKEMTHGRSTKGLPNKTGSDTKQVSNKKLSLCDELIIIKSKSPLIAK